MRAKRDHSGWDNFSQNPAKWLWGDGKWEFKKPGLPWKSEDHLEKRLMNAEQADLYRRIQKFSVDKPGSDFPFSQRLTQENGWTVEYTQRVLEEYKKFAFLAVAAGHPVAPSDQVDQAWHLHLVYTHSYWDEFCQTVLQKPLHHAPTQGGLDEQTKFKDWYTQTLTSYEAFFGYAPPEDIWPAPDIRFDCSDQFVRVNAQQSWILPKLRLDPRIVAGLPLMSVLFFTVCALFIPELVRPIEIWNPFSLTGPEFLKFYVIVAGISAAFAYYWRWRLWQPTPLQSSPQLDAYETAYLSNGGYRVVNTAIASLVQRGHLTLLPESQTLALADDLPEDSHPLEQVIQQTVEIDGRIGWVRLSALPAVEPITQALYRYGLLLTDDQAEVFRYYPALVACAVLPLGITRLLLGISLQRPVGYLIMLCVLIGWLGYFFLKEKPLYRSRFGERLLNNLRADNKHFKADAITSYPSQFAMVFALFGSSMLTGSPLADLGSTLAPVVQGISGLGGVGCGGGGGGGCGGGGCGG